MTNFSNQRFHLPLWRIFKCNTLEHWKISLGKGFSVGVVYMDLIKAFDTSAYKLLAQPQK